MNYIPAFHYSSQPDQDKKAVYQLFSVEQRVVWHPDAPSFNQVAVLLLGSHKQLIFASLLWAHQKKKKKRKK